MHRIAAWKGILLGALALLSDGCLTAGHAQFRQPATYWTQSFALSPTDGKPAPDLLKKYPGLANLPWLKGTVRYRFALSIGGTALRVQASNASDRPLRIAAGSVALAAGVMDAVPDTLHRLTFSGQPEVDIPANASVLSDPVNIAVDPLSEGGKMTWVGQDEVMSPIFQDPKQTVGRPLISGVLVARNQPTPVIAAFGDSITDGARLRPAEPHGWAAALARRLAQRPGGLTLGVVSAGIGGNRILSPGSGPSALARLDRDVFAAPGVEYVIVLEGINDIGNSDQPPGPGDIAPLSADQLIAGLAQIAARSRAHGLKVARSVPARRVESIL